MISFSALAWSLTFPFENARPVYVGSRPLGMGNAFTAVADDSEAGFWNPAGLIQWQGVKIFGAAKVSDREDYAFDSKCVAYSYRNTAFFWGNKIVTRGVEGYTPDFTYYSLARKLGSYVAVGGSVKFKRRHPYGYYQFFGYNPGYDLGVLWKLDNRGSAGVLIQNMGDAKKWVSIVTLGFAYRLLSIPLLCSADISILFGSRVGGDQVTLEPRFGWEWVLPVAVALRVGNSNGHPAVGMGLKLFALRVDYAWIRDARGAAHFLSGQVELK